MNFDVTIEIPKGQRMAHRSDIADVSEFELLEIQHFFEVYKELEPGKEVEAARWVGAARGAGRDRGLPRAPRRPEGGHP